MGTVKIDITNVLTITLVAFAGVFIINKALDKFGLNTWKA